MNEELNEVQLKSELSNIEKQIREIKNSLKPLENRKKDINKELERIQIQKEVDSGASKELIEFYKLKIPNGTGQEYMSWSISSQGLELFEKYVSTDYWNRYETNCFTDELDQALYEYDFCEDEDSLEYTREDIIVSFLNQELKSLEGLTEYELEIINDYMTICKGIKENNFKYDW